MDRRYFLMGAAAAVTAGGRVLASANDTVRIAIVGCGGRGGSHLREWTTLPNVELVAISDVDQSHMADFVKRVESSGKKAPRASRISASCSRTSPSTPSPSPRPTIGTPCRPSGPARRARTSTSRSPARTTCSKPARSWRRRRSTSASCSTAARAALAASQRGGAEDARRPDRRRLPGPRAVLQVARHHRPRAGRPCPRACTTTCGSGRRPSAPSPRTASTTTGTGSGTTATATSATRASTRSTWRAGAWA